MLYILMIVFFYWLPHSPQAEQLMKQIGVEGVSLTEYEMNIATHLVDPRCIKVNTNTVVNVINGNLSSNHTACISLHQW